MTFNCMTFPCEDGCCTLGVRPTEAEKTCIISSGLGTDNDFDPHPIMEDDGVHYHTKVTTRGCVFLQFPRGCRLHGHGVKPQRCIDFPLYFKDAQEMFDQDVLPCFHHRTFDPETGRCTW
jgi:hypothetical protein